MQKWIKSSCGFWLFCVMMLAGTLQAKAELSAPGSSLFATGFDVTSLLPAPASDTPAVRFYHGSSTPRCSSLLLPVLQNTPARGRFLAATRDGKPTRYELVSVPQKGRVTLEEDGFLYTPFPGCAGNDRFLFRAVDHSGTVSQPAVVQLEIERAPLFWIDDLSASGEAYPVRKLIEAGILSCEETGKTRLFYPERTVTNAEMLLLATAAAGCEAALSPCVNTGLPDDEMLPAWLKPYLAQALEEGWIDPDIPFEPDHIPTRAEAVSFFHRVAALPDIQRCNLPMRDLGEIPAWALPAYMNLSAYRLMPSTTEAKPQQPLDRLYAAGLLWGLRQATTP